MGGRAVWVGAGADGGVVGAGVSGGVAGLGAAEGIGAIVVGADEGVAEGVGETDAEGVSAAVSAGADSLPPPEHPVRTSAIPSNGARCFLMIPPGLWCSPLIVLPR